MLLGLESATENEVANRKSHHELHHEDGHDHDHDHDEFESFVVEVGPVGNPAQFMDTLRSVIEEHDVLRLKGFADVKGKPMRLVDPGGRRADRSILRPRVGERSGTQDTVGRHRIGRSGSKQD